MFTISVLISLFFIGLLLVVTDLIRQLLARFKKLTPGREKVLWRIRAALFGTVVAGFALIFLDFHVASERCLARLAAVCAQSGARVTIGVKADAHVLDAADSAEFLELLRSGTDVSAHHSYPIDIRRIDIEGEGHVFYQLGKDCDEKDEFWLEEKSPPDCVVCGVRVRQFHLPALTEFLKWQYEKRRGTQQQPADGSDPRSP
jgi:hypothetical protein